MASKIKILIDSKPNLHKRLFWDWRYEAIDWQKNYVSIIGRVIERGTNDELDELNRFYGRPKVVKTLLTELKYLPDYAIEWVVEYFGLKKEDLACYKRKQIRRGHWI